MNSESNAFFHRKIFWEVVHSWKQILLGTMLITLLGTVAYAGIVRVRNSHPAYSTEYIIYLDFGDDRDEGLNYYNGYTWGQLITTDPIADNATALLPEGYTKEGLLESCSVELKGDSRVMSLIVTAQSAEACKIYADAMSEAIVQVRFDDVYFDTIDVIKTEEPTALLADYFPYQAMLSCAIGGLLLMVLGYTLKWAVSDCISFPEELSELFGIPCLGVENRKGQSFFPEEVSRHLYAIREDKTGLVLLKDAEAKNKKLTDVSYATCRYDALTEDQTAALRECDQVVLCFPADRVTVPYLKHVQDELSQMGISVSRGYLTGGSFSLLRKFYRV